MTMKIACVIPFSILLAFPGFDCQQSNEPVPDPRVVYFSSFESDADTAGWSGYGASSFDRDAPPDGGSRSLRVAGGCIVPHASRTLTAPPVPCTLTLEFWGKNLALGGGVGLRRADGVAIGIGVQDTVWKFYRSAERLTCRPGESLVLEMVSGGIVYSAMRVDLLVVRRVE
jgi:hypothetical protein